MKWISVKDRVPESTELKLLVYDGKAINFGRYYHKTEFGHIFGISGWGQTYNITHWLVLEAPKP